MPFNRKDERLVGRVPVDSSQIVVLDPVNLPGDSEPYYQRVVELTLDKGAGEVTFEAASPGEPDGVAVETNTDGSFPVYVTYGKDGSPTEIRIELTDPGE